MPPDRHREHVLVYGEGHCGLPEGLGTGRIENRGGQQQVGVSWPTITELSHSLFENTGLTPGLAAPGSANASAAANHHVNGVLTTDCPMSAPGPIPGRPVVNITVGFPRNIRFRARESASRPQSGPIFTAIRSISGRSTSAPVVAATRQGTPRQVLVTDTFVVHQPLLFKQGTVCVSGIFPSTGGTCMTGRVHPAMMSVLAAEGPVSSVRTAAPAQNPRRGLTRRRRWRSPLPPEPARSRPPSSLPFVFVSPRSSSYSQSPHETYGAVVPDQGNLNARPAAPRRNPRSELLSFRV